MIGEGENWKKRRRDISDYTQVSEWANKGVSELQDQIKNEKDDRRTGRRGGEISQTTQSWVSEQTRKWVSYRTRLRTRKMIREGENWKKRRRDISDYTQVNEWANKGVSEWVWDQIKNEKDDRRRQELKEEEERYLRLHTGEWVSKQGSEWVSCGTRSRTRKMIAEGENWKKRRRDISDYTQVSEWDTHVSEWQDERASEGASEGTSKGVKLWDQSNVRNLW